MFIRHFHSLRPVNCPLAPHNSPEIHFADGGTESQLTEATELPGS